MKSSVGSRTLLYPAPALIVGTYDKVGKANGMAAAWTGICCSKPPSVAVALRKATYTYGNVVDRKAFTLNIPSDKLVAEVDYFGMASGRDEDKFTVTGLTPVRGEFVDAPYVQECPVVLECRLTHTLELGLHTQFIGEIVDVKADEEVLGDDGVPDMAKVRPLVFAPESRSYYGLGEYLGRAFSIGKKLR
jgi:flavin reductase (DIM6/NTAB) family NADH-FMN oxidoreductase RutF